MAGIRTLLAIGLACLAFSEAVRKDGDVALVRGTAYKGLLMVYYQGRAGYVCDDVIGGHTQASVGRVACRNLGREYVSIRSGQSGPTGSFMLDDLGCKGTESSLAECAHAAWRSDNCNSNECLSVTCSNYPCDGNNGGCTQICTNSADKRSSSCSCRSGYSLNSDNKTCDDINECLVDNGGCSHTCVNTIGSRICQCPRYLYLSEDNSTCTADGFTVDCASSFGMTIIMDKTTFFFLPQHLTLTDTSCTSQSNSTHVWLYTDYNKCSTSRKVVGNEIIYSNAVLDSKTKTGGIKFFDSIKIPFQCRLSANRTITQGLSPVANQLIMRIDRTGRLTPKFVLLNGDKDNSPELPTYYIKQGNLVYAKMHPSIGEVSLLPQKCDVFSEDSSSSQNLISNGQPANFLTKILTSNHYRFSYPVFTFSDKGDQLLLTCNSSLAVDSSVYNAVNDTRIITSQEVDLASSQIANAVNDPVPRIIRPGTGVELVCGPKSMRLSMDPAVTVGLSLGDLQPLRENCFGFYAVIENGRFVYNIPLSQCGAEIKKMGDRITFTNSLVYSSNMTSKVKYFSDVILTHSCSYPLSSYMNTVNYTVRSNNFNFGAENKKKANFDVSLNVFSDDMFKKMLNSGGAVSIAEGRHLFGDIGVTSSDPNLKVALNDCKVTPTSRADDPNSHVVIKNGCKTAYGTRVFSRDRFSILTRSFVDHRGQQVYLHCSVVVCGTNNMARCERKCSTPADVIGKRSEQPSALEMFVSAGPFYVN